MFLGQTAKKYNEFITDEIKYNGITAYCIIVIFEQCWRKERKNTLCFSKTYLQIFNFSLRI